MAKTTNENPIKRSKLAEILNRSSINSHQQIWNQAQLIQINPSPKKICLTIERAVSQHLLAFQKMNNNKQNDKILTVRVKLRVIPAFTIDDVKKVLHVITTNGGAVATPEIKNPQSVLERVQKESINEFASRNSMKESRGGQQPQSYVIPKKHHKKQRSQISQGVETVYEDSYDRGKYIRENSLKKDGELFNESSQVSEIHNSGNLQFMEEYVDDENMHEEDTSAKRLLPGEGQIMKGNDAISVVDQSEYEQNQNNNPPQKSTFSDKKQNQVNVRSLKLNKIQPLNLPINIQNVKEDKAGDDFEFEQDSDNVKKVRQIDNFHNKKQSLGSDITDTMMMTHTYQNNNQYTRRDSNELNMENQEIQEQSCLLDESQLKKSIKMPQVDGDKMRIQEDLGLRITQDDNNPNQVILKNMVDEDSFYRIIDKDSIEVVESYVDRFPCLGCRKTLMKIRVYINRMAIMIITNPLFETVSIIVIIANSLFLALDDPLAITTPPYQNYSDTIFQVLYTVEMVLKICAMGLFFNQNAYLRDSWNILDCVIVVSGYISMLMSGGGANLSVLRSFRVIRPLRTISSIQGLRVIVSALVAALPLLRDTILVLLFFFLIFAIAGVQLFSGTLKNRCVYIETGIPDPNDVMCAGDDDCIPGQFCGQRNANPNYDASTFDNLFYALLLVFQTVTLEGWTANMISTEKCVATWTIGYFIPIVFIGAFFLLNLTIAVIKSKFTEEHKKNKVSKKKNKKAALLKKRGIDESSEEDNGDRKDTEAKFLEALEEKELLPEKKKQLKEKFRIDQFVKKVDLALRTREAQDQLAPMQSMYTPRTLLIRQSRNRSLDDIPASAQKQQYNFNYEELFKPDKINPQKELQLSDYTDKPIEIQEQFQQSPSYRHDNKKMKSQEDVIKEDDEEESHDLDQLLEEKQEKRPELKVHSGLKIKQMYGIQGIKKNKNTNKLISPYLGQMFEIKKFKYTKDQRRQTQSKVIMSGIAGLDAKKKSLDEGPQQENVKKAVYEKLHDNFDIFDFLESDDQYGDDEFSDDANLRNDKNDEEIEVERVQNGTIHKKSTFESSDSKLARNSKRTNKFATENGALKLNYLTDSSARNPMEKQKLLNFLRMRTLYDYHTDYQHQESSEDEEHKNTKSKKRSRSIKDRIVNYFKKKKKENAKKKEEAKKKKLMEKQKKINRSLFLKDKTMFKSDLEKSIRSSSLSHNQTYELDMVSTGGRRDLMNQQTTTNFGMPSVRSRSEKKKKEIQLREHLEFKEKEKIMRNRRNVFFAQSVKQIGKSKEDLKKDKKNRIINKRMIKLGGGFELPTEKSEKYNLRKLLKSGSLDCSFSEFQIDEKQTKPQKISMMNVDNPDQSMRNPILKKSFMEDQFKSFFSLKKKKNLEEDAPDNKIPNLEAELQKSKKKIAIKLKHYKFESIDDVLEEREEKERRKKHEEKPNLLMKILKKKLQKDKKKENKIEDEQKKMIKTKILTDVKAYQKKIKLEQRKYNLELMQQEAHESDENQEDVMKRLEDYYNINHRSNIYVTGTLSVVFDKPKGQNKILNSTYYANINAQKNPDSRNRTRQTLRIINSGQGIRINTGSNNGGSIIDNNMSLSGMGSIVGGVVVRSSEMSGLRVPVAKNSSIRNSGNSKLGSQRSAFGKKKVLQTAQSPTKSLEKRGRSLFNTTGMQSRVTAGAQTDYSPTIMRPEIMTDRQILKRLNLEVKKSKIFNQINFKKLPDEIKRKDVNLFMKKKPKKIAKKKKTNPLKPDEPSDKDASDTCSEKMGFEQDYFLDRNFDMTGAVEKAKKDAVKMPRDIIEWSGQDIIEKFDPYKARIAINNLNEIRVWPKGIYGYFKRWRVFLKRIMKSALVENFMTLCVFANTVILALDHYGIDDNTNHILTSFNSFFTITFTCEMGLKIIAIGIVKFLQDKMNYMDGGVVIMSLVEMAFMSGSGALSAFRSIRMFRTLRVLRVARLLRGLKSMMNILSVIQRSISSFIYLGMLLFLFIFIYALLGMQMFGGQFGFLNGSNRYNFDSFNSAFVTSFILLTMENWNQVLYNAMHSDVNKGITVLYFISAIFIGNFMLLNLFLAILLDAFTSVDEEDHDTIEKKMKRDQDRIEGLKSKDGENLITGISDVEGAKMESTKSDKNKKKKRKQRKKKNEAQSNMLEESIEIDIETLETKKQERSKMKKKLFEGIECENALYIFSKQNKIRQLIYRVITNTKFETFILVIIILSSLKLIYDTYLFSVPDDDLRNVISGKFDYFFTALFTCECVMKCIAFGFIQDKNSYLRETWSQLDFFIVVTSLIDASFSNVSIGIIKILRLLRILRPLRFISHNSSMKTVVIALLDSMSGLFNVGIVVVAVFLMFAILGVNLYAGKLQYCTVNIYTVDTSLQCFKERGQWKTNNQNFDNVYNGMITLFTVATLEGWPDLMYSYTDIKGLEKGPKQGNSPINAYFFVGFVFIGAFFFMNLFVGVLFMNFEAAQKDEAAALLLDSSEVRWVDMMKMIIKTKPDIIKVNKNKIRKWVYEFTAPESKFDFFIMMCIIGNMVQMAMNFEGQSVGYTHGLEYSNYVFTAIFALECILKLIGNGVSYFVPTWHKFDFFVVIASFVDIIMGQMSSTSLKFLRVGPQLARVLRVLRVSRLFRLLNKYKGLQALLQTITFSLPSLFNVFALLMLVYFIFSVLGVFMFRSIIDGKIIDEKFMNFKNFGQAMIILIRMSTGEDWPTIMFDTMNTRDDCTADVNCGYAYSPVFFIPFIMVCTYVMLNLFIMVIIQQFEMYYLPDDNILTQFREDLEEFKKVWQKYAREYEGMKIRMLDLLPFFKELKGNIGMKGENNEIMRNMVKMNLEADEEGFIYFNELLFQTMKRRYGQERTKKKILAELELRALDKLQQIKAKLVVKSRQTERFKAVTVNPFLAVMYKNMSFRAWVKQYNINLQKREDEQQYQLERESSDEEMSNKGLEDEYEYVTDQDITVIEDDLQDNENQDSMDSMSPSNLNLLENDLVQKESTVQVKALQDKKSTMPQNQPKKQFTIKLRETQRIVKSSESQKEENSMKEVEMVEQDSLEDKNAQDSINNDNYQSNTPLKK